MNSKPSSEHNLPGTMSQSASGVTTPSLVADEKELNRHLQSDGEKGADTLETSPVASEDYPTGSRLAFILISLILSVFLVSLDMVSSSLISTLARY
jgi:hypothetical protein